MVGYFHYINEAEKQCQQPHGVYSLHVGLIMTEPDAARASLPQLSVDVV